MILELEEMEVRAGTFHVGPITVRIDEGEYLVVLGPTGAGKTVTLEAISGLRKTCGGRVRMDGRDVTHAPPEARRIGFLYQDSLLFPHLSVRGNLAYGAHRISPTEREAAITRLARMLQIEPLLERSPSGLSGGERRRVALARAMAANPVLLLLDEPMAALDPNSREGLRDILRELHRELGTTTIHVTHSFSEALALADRIAILIQGKLLQVAPARAVFATPASPEIAGFLKSAATDDQSPDPTECRVTLQPESISLSLSTADTSAAPRLDAAAAKLGADTTPGEHTLTGRILAAERNGTSLELLVNVGMTLRTSVALDEPGVEKLYAGAGVLVRLPQPISDR